MTGTPETVEGSVVFAEALGFCGGVRAADELMHGVSAAASPDTPVIGLHHIVHNGDVVAAHEAAGVRFVDGIDDIPRGSAVVISAHGVGPEIFAAIREKGGEAFDATCPLVTRTHHGVQLAREGGEKVLYVCHGKPGEVETLHDEVAGMVGHLDFRTDQITGKVAYDPVARSYLELGDDVAQMSGVLSEGQRYRIISQTTLNGDDALRYRAEVIAAIKALQPEAQVAFVPNGDVCMAVRDRQQAVRRMMELGPSRAVVVTDPESKNGRSYVTLARQLAEGTDTTVHAVANADEALQIGSTDGLTAITASASTPDKTVAEVAAVFGASGVPDTDRPFSLPHSKPGVIEAKFSTLAVRKAME